MHLTDRLYRKLALTRLKKSGAGAGKCLAPKLERVNSFLFSFSAADPDKIMEQLSIHQEEILAGFKPSDLILIKINANSSLPYPASTSPGFLLALLTWLHKNGLHQLTVGDCSSNAYLPTRRVFSRLGMLKLMKGKADFLGFENGSWLEAAVPDGYLGTIRLSQHLFNFDKIISLTNMKTHCWADYSLAMKNLVGFVHPLDRILLHQDHLQEKVAELSLLIRPDLNIVDGRRFFITGGPNEGEVAVGNTVWVSNDLLTIDRAAYKQLYDWKLAAGVEGSFSSEPDKMRQIAHYLNVHAPQNQEI